MPILGSIIKGAIDIRSRIPRQKQRAQTASKAVAQVLTKAQFYAFGEHYKFSELALLENL